MEYVEPTTTNRNRRILDLISNTSIPSIMKTTLPILSEVTLRSNIDYKTIITYAGFLIQLLTLEMFIPCKDGVPLEEPMYGMSGYDHKYLEYQQSLDRVIFKGFYIKKWLNETHATHVIVNDWNVHVFWLDSITKQWRISKGLKSIQDLEGKVQLTDKQHKLLNL